MLQIGLHLTAFWRTDRKRFVAQEMVVRFLEPVRADRETGDDILAVQAVLDAAYKQARAGATLRRASELDVHLQATVDEAAHAWRSWTGRATAKLNRAVDKKLVQFRSAVAAMQCNGCVHDDLCKGILRPQLPRSDIVSPCLQKIDQMAREAADFTRDIYRRHVPALTQQVDIDLSVTALSDKAVRVTGVTEFTRPKYRFDLAGSARRVWIEIGVPIAALEEAQYFSLLYVMVHELAVHAVQQLLMVVPSDPLERVAFAEGLIDRVVHEELILTLQERKMSRLGFPMRAIGDIKHFHITRKDEQEKNAGFWQYDLDSGDEAYEFLLRVGKFLLRSSRLRAGEARDWAHATALSLNLLAVSEEDRQQIASGLSALAQTYGTDANDNRGWPGINKADWEAPLAMLISALVKVHDYPDTGMVEEILRAMGLIPGLEITLQS